tara:strand:+ start:560 stop:2113 length:1554 start_codon:yes stop_codon:yes gene_type:complete
MTEILRLLGNDLYIGNNRIVSIKERLEGKFLLLYFLISDGTNPYCNEFTEILKKIYKEIKSDIEIISVNYNFMNKNNTELEFLSSIPWSRVSVSKSENLFSRFDVKSVPKLILFDSEGEVKIKDSDGYVIRSLVNLLLQKNGLKYFINNLHDKKKFTNIKLSYDMILGVSKRRKLNSETKFGSIIKNSGILASTREDFKVSLINLVNNVRGVLHKNDDYYLYTSKISRVASIRKAYIHILGRDTFVSFFIKPDGELYSESEIHDNIVNVWFSDEYRVKKISRKIINVSHKVFQKIFLFSNKLLNIFSRVNSIMGILCLVTRVNNPIHQYFIGFYGLAYSFIIGIIMRYIYSFISYRIIHSFKDNIEGYLMGDIDNYSYAETENNIKSVDNALREEKMDNCKDVLKELIGTTAKPLTINNLYCKMHEYNDKVNSFSALMFFDSNGNPRSVNDFCGVYNYNIDKAIDIVNKNNLLNKEELNNNDTIKKSFKRSIRSRKASSSRKSSSRRNKTQRLNTRK